MNFLVLASRMAKTTTNTAMRMLARSLRKFTSNTPEMAHKMSAAAKAADMMSDTLLPAFKKPIRPPTTSSTM